jgi:hypothetical protein
MRDFIWTVIIIWVVYKLVDVFKIMSQKKTYAYQQDQSQNIDKSFPKKDIKSAMQKGAEKEGEYVDYEDLSK